MKLFFVEIGSPYSFDLANKLEENGFKISHTTSSSRLKDLPEFIKEKGRKNVQVKKLYCSEDLTKNYKEYFTPLNANIIKAFTPIERDFWILTDRTNSVPVSFRKRKLLYYDLIRFWLGYLEREQIEAIYFPYTPHAPWELVLMQAARYLSVPYCYLSHTAINNRSIFRTSYEEFKKTPANHLKDKTAAQIKKQIPKELLKDFEEESVVTNVIKLENDAFQGQKGINADAGAYKTFLEDEKTNWLQSIKLEAKLALRSAVSFLGLIEDEFKLPEAMNKSKKLWGWEFATLKHRYIATQLKKYYESRTDKIDLKEKYIYFPLHLQPELTSQPEAGIFEDQQVALEMLLQALPKGWKIYIKDNPRQFDHTINKVSAIHFRDKFDIDRYKINERVLIVPQNIKSEDLIENSQITATLTGTAGWESLNLGKPCMTFGKPWYSATQSCFTVSSVKEIEKALKDSSKKTKKDVQIDVLKYIHDYQDKLVIATLHATSDVSYNSRPYSELLHHHAAALKDFFKLATAV